MRHSGTWYLLGRNQNRIWRVHSGGYMVLVSFVGPGHYAPPYGSNITQDATKAPLYFAFSTELRALCTYIQPARVLVPESSSMFPLSWRHTMNPPHRHWRVTEVSNSPRRSSCDSSTTVHTKTTSDIRLPSRPPPVSLHDHVSTATTTVDTYVLIYRLPHYSDDEYMEHRQPCRRIGGQQLHRQLLQRNAGTVVKKK